MVYVDASGDKDDIVPYLKKFSVGCVSVRAGGCVRAWLGVRVYVLFREHAPVRVRVLVRRCACACVCACLCGRLLLFAPSSRECLPSFCALTHVIHCVTACACLCLCLWLCLCLCVYVCVV